MKPYYERDGITIYNADCRDVLPGVSADLLCTDPPYGIGVARRDFVGGSKKITAFAGRMVPTRDYGHSNWDDKPVDGELLQLAMSRCPAQIIFGGNYFDLGPARGYFVWDKGRRKMSFADAEMAWTNLDSVVRVIQWKWNGFIQQAGHPKEQRFHPTQKPQGVMSWVLQQVPTAESVLDPFMGVGSTLIAARDLGRRAIGIELEEKYCEIAAQRLEKTALAKAA